MNPLKPLAIPVVFVAILTTGQVLATEPTDKELMEEIRALRAKVDQLERTQNDQKSREVSKAEADATLESVLRDSDKRSQLIQAQGFTAGYDKGRFVIRSENGDFSLSPGLQLQARYIANYREEDAADKVNGDAHTESGFEISRLKLLFEGNVFGPATTYRFQWNTNSNDGDLTLEEAFVKHQLGFAPDFYIKGGQFRDPTFHEEITSDFKQLAVDRSLANEVLGGGQTRYVQGVALIWDDGLEGLPLRAEVGFVDGPNSANTNFVDGGGSPGIGAASPDFGIYGRAEYLAFGDWRHYDDFTAKDNPQDTLVFGAGAFYTQAGDNDSLLHTFDAQYEMYLLGLYAAYYGVYSNTSSEGSSYDFGFVVQAGYMIDKKWEAFGRYSLVSLDSGNAGSKDDNFHELTAGVNYYMRDHAAKFTLDLSYLPSGIPSNQPLIGELDPDGDEDQLLLRGQFQLML